ncbi:MAG: protein kinase [Azoarcus sp.]|jgi:non-specific serine/threonine protein kinase|nr:protein kinase [Azoarcus sp.]
MDQAAAPHRPILTVAPPAPLDALPAGTRLQTFEILAVAGEGGFSVVYLARDTSLDREVAIKEYLPAVHAVRIDGHVMARSPAKRSVFESGMRHFVAEARILAQLRHPALSEVLRFFQANGTAYMVMPHYRGHTLREMIRGGYRVAGAKELLGIVLPLLDGLVQLHAIPCAHLDISSDNIMVQENGAPVLLDFGAARRAQIDRSDPATIILKPGFAPIEQYSHDEESGLNTGPWSDIYALSAVMYQLVSGKMPVVSVARTLHDSLKPLSRFAMPGLPAEILKVIEAGLAVQPHDRPDSAGAFSEALKKAARKPAWTYLLDRGRAAAPRPVTDPAAPGETETGNKTPEEDRRARRAVAFPAVSMRLGASVAGLSCLAVLTVAVLFASVMSGNERGNGNEEVIDVDVKEDDPSGPGGTESTAPPEEDDAPADGNDTGGEATPPPVVDPVETAPPPRSLPASGWLEVRVEPWGHVYLDGKHIGVAPPAVTVEAPAGIHLIEVRNESHLPYRQGIDLKKGRRVRITHDFTASAAPGRREALP